MKRNGLYTLGVILVLLSMVLASCAQPAAPTAEAPAATVAVPAVTEAPTQPPPPTEAPTQPPPPTAAPAVTEAPTAAPAVTEAPAAPAAPDYLKKVAVENCDYGGNVKAIEAVDELTVKITFCQSDPSFLAKVAVPAFGILDSDYIKEIGADAAKLADNPVGTGPYVVKEWVRGDHITFAPNPDYWWSNERPVKNKEFIVKWNKEAAARLLDLQSGNVDGIAEISVDDVETVNNDSNLKLYPRIFNNFLYIGVNNAIKPFDNEKIRQAFAMAIDKQKIVDDFYMPGAQAATQFVPPGVKPGFTDGYEGVKYDPEKAKAMLTEAGFDFKQEIVLSYAERTRPYFPQPTKIAQAVQAQLAEIGLNVKLSMQEWATYLPSTREGKEALFFLGWSEDYPDATNWYDVFLMGSSKSFGAPFPDITELIKKAATTGDAAQRQKYYDEVNKLYDQHVPNIVVAHGVTSLAFKAGTQNVIIGPYNENFQEMQNETGTLVYEQDGEPVSMYCNDETDGSSFLACRQVFNQLYEFKWGSTESVPGLAESCTPNADATEWTCKLRSGVKYSNGATLDASDVVATFTAMWDYNSPFRKGNTGAYQYWKDFFGPKALNEPAS